MKFKMLKFCLSLLTIFLMFLSSVECASADTWQYGDLTKIVAASNGGGTQWDTYRQVGLSVDDQNIYIYVSMDPDKYSSSDSTLNTGDRVIQLTGYVLTIAGQTLYIDSHNNVNDLQDSKVSQTKTYSPDVYSSSKGNVYIQDAITVDHLVRDNGNRVNNIIKMTLPLNKLGIELPATSKVTLTNSNIWAGGVSITVNGASSGPWVLVTIGLTIAVGGYLRLRKSLSLQKKGREQYAY